MSFKEIVKSSGRTLLTTVGVTVLGFAISVLTTRMLGPEGRGLLSGSLLIIGLSTALGRWDLAYSYIYFRGTGLYFHQRRFVYLSALVIGVGTLLLAAVGVRINDNAILHQHIALITAFAVVTGLQNYLFNLSQLETSLAFLNLTRICGAIFNLAALGVLYWLCRPVQFEYILIGQMVCALVLIAMCLQWCRLYLFSARPAPDELASLPRARTSDMVKYALNQHGTGLVALAMTYFDKVYLLKVGTIEEFGYYTLAFTTSRLIGAIHEAMNTALYSRYAGKEEGELNSSINTAFRFTLVPMLVLAGIGSVLAPWLIRLAYGPKFDSVTPSFIILMFECVLSGAAWTLAQRFNAGGKPGLILRRHVLSLIPLVLMLPFLPKENISVYLALLMLLGAVLRMIITLAMYPYVLKQPVPRLVPTMAEIRKLVGMIKARWERRRLGGNESA
jgi:O-antigen/teichoic acid export membrane protein